MPKIEIDYSNTIIYKIICKDSNVNDVYVGHTTNFVQRKHAHKQSCINNKSHNYKCKLYETIRNNGGWDNWNMEIINFFNCKDHFEARQKEQEYYISLNANLNSIEPLSSTPKFQYKKVLNNDDTPNTVISTPNLVTGVTCTNKYTCNSCKYSTCRKSQYDRHLATTKHNLTTKYLKYNSKPINKEYKCVCGKIYKYDSGYYRHKKTCAKQNIHYDNHNNIISMHDELKIMMCEILEKIKLMYPLP